MSNWNKCDLMDINFTFTKKEEGRKLITQRDSYIDNLTQQDLNLRCDKRDATLDDYLKLCEEAVLDFTEKEEAQLSLLLCEIDSELKRRGMVLPSIEQVNLVKTTGMEENDAYGYTRGKTIYINQKTFDNDAFLEHLLVHELFHIMTRNCQDFKKAMYDIIGFKVEDKFFSYPESRTLHFVSNPDVSNQVCHARFKVGRGYQNVVVMTDLSYMYGQGNFHKRFRPFFLPIDENLEFVRDESGELAFINPTGGYDEYHEHIGRNTSYTTNPEEALAENFVIAVLGTLNDLPNPEIIDSIRKTMKTHSQPLS